MVTMKDIAERAGVSRTTVSFVLNGRCHKDQRVSEAVQKKVLDAAEELGMVSRVSSSLNRPPSTFSPLNL